MAALGIAGSGNITKGSGPPVTAAAAPASPSPSPSPSPSSSLSGPVGTDPRGDKMSVTLTLMIDPAQGADQFTTSDNGNRLVGAVFSIKGISGTFSDDANSDAALIGSRGQTYTADFDNIAGHTNFNSAEHNVGRATSPCAPSPSRCP